MNKISSPAWLIILLQVAIGLGVSLACYFFIDQSRQSHFLTEEIRKLQAQTRQLGETEERLARYEKFLLARPALQEIPAQEVWKSVDFAWQKVSLAELLGRIEALYYQNEVFFLDEFRVIMPIGGPDGQVRRDIMTLADLVSHQPIFQVKGRFLCPCQ